MKKSALLFHPRVTHHSEPESLRITGVAPKSGFVPALVSVALFLALMVYFLAEAISR